MTTNIQRAESLEGELLAACAEAQRRFGYRPNAFLIMLRRYGAVETARRLLRPGQEPQSGLFRLWEWRVLDLSLEAIVLQPESTPRCLSRRSWTRQRSDSGASTSPWFWPVSF